MQATAVWRGLFAVVTLCCISSIQARICYKNQPRQYQQSYSQSYSQRYSYRYTVSCGSWTWGARCGRTGYAYRTAYRLSYYTAVRYVATANCCPGYIYIYNRCTPVCGICVNGDCIAPNTCSCRQGWSGSGCNTDIPECSTNNGDCDHICTNTLGSYSCSCNDGYLLDPNGRTCNDINECDVTNGNCAQECTNTNGGHYCSCREGYEFEPGDDSDSTNDGRACLDVDECSLGNGNCEHTCINTVGSRECSCDDGYRLDSDNQGCSDIDECAESLDNCTGGVAECVNKLGSFQCTCPNGYTLNGNLASCDDIDECDLGISGCNQVCTNNVGSFECSCNDGYELDSDALTCLDVDECEEGADNCQQECVNTEGSFSCACSRGFSLASDGISCDRDRCPTLTAPLNGRMTTQCGDQTGDVCQFTCDPGYTLTGSPSRICTPSSTWSGSMPTCQPRRCEDLSAPEGGAILPPCNNEFGSNCTTVCSFGYELEGPNQQRCVVDSTGDTRWTQAPKCIESVSPCESNPCENGGVCSPQVTEDIPFQCDCSGTGFEGPTCNRGILTTPTIPTLNETEMSAFNISAKASSDLVVRLDGGRDLIVRPSQITLNRENPVGTFELNGTAGRYTLNYEISGTIASDFEMPDSSPILISESRTPDRINRYFKTVETEPGSLVESCCQHKNLRYRRCPRSTDSVLFRSTCYWESAGFGRLHSTGGLVFTQFKSLILPLAINGIIMEYKRFGSVSANLSPTPIHCGPCNENSDPKSAPPGCYFFSFNSGDVEDLLNSNSLAKTFMDRISRLIPSWLSVSIPTNSTASTSFGDIDFATTLVEQEGVALVEECENVVPDDPGLYTVLRYRRMFGVSVDNEPLTYTPSDGSESTCVAVNLCQENTSPVYLGLPPDVRALIRQFPVTAVFDREGWQYDMKDVALYATPRSVSVSDTYWNGTKQYSPVVPNYDLRMNTESTIRFESSQIGYVAVRMEHQGTVFNNFPSIEERTVYLEGDTSLLLQIRIDGIQNNLTLVSSQAAVIYTDGNAVASPCNQGLSLKTTYIPRANQDFFANLFPLAEVTPECPMDIILNFDHVLQFHGLSMSLSYGCPMLQLDRLLFSMMDHTVYFHEKDSPLLTCPDRLDFAPSIQDPVMTIYSSLRNLNSISLGRFINLLQEPGVPTMTTVYSAEGGVGHRSQMHSAVVSILGTMINTPIELGNGVLSLESTAKVYSAYNATLTVMASTDMPWDRQVLSVLGQLSEDSNTDIEGFVRDYIQGSVIERANARKQNVEMAVNRSDGQVNMLEAEYSAREMRLMQANDSYMQALDMLQNATDELAIAEAAFEGASDEVQEAETELDRVCNENDDCPEIQRDELRCTMCYMNIYAVKYYTCPRLERGQVCGNERVYPDIMSSRRQCIQHCSTHLRCWCLFFFPLCYYRTNCRGVCKQVSFEEPNFRPICRPTTQLVNRMCPGEGVSARVPQTCCETVRALAEDTQCKEDCRNFRELAIQGLEQSKQELAAPFQALESARASYASARGLVSRESLRRDSAENMRDQIIPPLNSAKMARDLSIQNRMKVLGELEKELRLTEQVTGQEMTQNDVFEIISAKFNVTIESTSPTSIPVTILYESSALQLTRSVVVIFDFLSPREVNLRKITEVIVQDMLDTNLPIVRRRSAARFRRQADENPDLEGELLEKTPTEMQFEENCATILALQQFVQRLEDGLLLVEGNNEESRRKLEASIADLREKMNERNDANIDFETLRDFFNVSLDGTVRETFNQESSDYRDYLVELIRTAFDSLQNINSTSFITWQTSTELLYDEIDSVLDQSCSGFADCLEVVSNLAEQLVSDLPASTERDQLFDEFQQSLSDLMTLATSMDLTLSDAIDITTSVRRLLKADLISTYWCSARPNITNYPPFRVNVAIRTDLVMNCSADSSLPLAAHWRRNGVPIPNANNQTLLIENIQMSDSGNYTCVFTNAVGSSESPITNVTVYELPEFFSVLEPVTTMVGNDSGAFFSCNASGFPYPGWRWYFRSHPLQPWTEIPDEDTNELTIPSPRFKNRGWYTCEAYNVLGYKRAEAVYLTVLPRTVSRLSLGVGFTLATDTSNDGIEELGSGFSGDEIDCSVDDLDNIVLEYLTSQFELGAASIERFDITFNPNLTEFSVSFAIVSENVTNNRIRRDSFEKIQNRALPSRGDAIRAKDALQEMFSAGGVTFTCNSLELSYQFNSLNFDVLEYLCPEGQELNSDFLLCVGCTPGRYQTTTEGIRVFNGEGYKERYPVCRPCPVGTFADEIGSGSCQSCPEYYQTRFTGSDSVQDCYIDPLLLECRTEGSGSEVTIDCQTNRPPVATLCSFDGGLEHHCDYPIVINMRNNFSPGIHVITWRILDALGFTATASVNFELNDDKPPSNTTSMVPPLGVIFINRSPRVSLGRMEAEFVLTRPVASVTCQLQGVDSTTDCSSGQVVYPDLPPGRYVFRVAAINYKKEDRAIVRRRFRVPPNGNQCLVHLVDRGLVVDDRSGNVTVDFDGVGPIEGYLCSVDLQGYTPCSPPVVLSGLSAGPHTLLVDPQGCQRNRRRVKYNFAV